MPTKLTQEEFIHRSNEKHNYQYDYSLVQYENVSKKIKIICKTHGEFLQTPNAHLHQGQGCLQCGLTERSKHRTKTQEQFIEEAKNIHGDRYIYSNTVYKKMKTKVEIICKEHGSFWQTPEKHIIQKCGCPKCKVKNQHLTQEEFIERARKIHNNKYDYNKTNYLNVITPVTIVCPIHGEFHQKAGGHLAGMGCPHCCGKIPLTQEQFIERCKIKHNNRYDYSKCVFTNCATKVEIICEKHGSFWARATSHYHDGTRCPKCCAKISKKETKWLDSLNIPDDSQHRQVFIKVDNRKFHVDGFDPATNTVYEFLGDFWHGNLKKFDPEKINTVNKKTFKQLNEETFQRIETLKQSGYNVVWIWESEFKLLEKQFLK